MARKAKSSPKRGGNQSLKSFRHDIATLKKRGLVDKKVDARKVRPTPALKRKLKLFDDVVKGDAKVYNVTKKQAKDLKETGHKVVGQKLILKSEAGTRADYKAGRVTVKQLGKNGFERVELPIPYKDLNQWLEAAKNDPALENLKRPTDQWAFQFFGYNSYSTFASLDDALERLQHYETTGEAIDEDDPEAMAEVYRGIAIYRVKKGRWPKSYKEGKHAAKKRSGRQHMKRRRPQAYARMLAKERERDKKRRQKNLGAARERERERQRRYRAKLKENKTLYAIHKRKDRTRKQKERAKK